MQGKCRGHRQMAEAAGSAGAGRHTSAVGLGICLPPAALLIYVWLMHIKVTPHPTIKNLYTTPPSVEATASTVTPEHFLRQNKLLLRNQTNSCFCCTPLQTHGRGVVHIALFQLDMTSEYFYI